MKCNVIVKRTTATYAVCIKVICTLSETWSSWKDKIRWLVLPSPEEKMNEYLTFDESLQILQSILHLKINKYMYKL